MNSNNRLSIGIWLTHGIGDVIMAMPLLQKLIANGSDLMVFVKSNLVKSLICYAFIDKQEQIKVFVVGQRFNIFYFLVRIKFKSFLFVHGDTTLKYMLIAFFIRSKRKIGVQSSCRIKNLFYTKTIEHGRLHKVNFFLAFGGFSPISEYPRIVKVQNFYKHKKKTLIIAPGSGIIEKHKRWPEQKWAQLIQKISRFVDINFVLFGSVNEISLLEKIKKLISYPIDVKIRVPSTIRESFEILYSASLVVSVCNGTSHMASLIGVGVVGLYGPTNYTYTGVFGKRFSPIFKGYSCSPCYRRNFIQGCGTPKCMIDINIDEVVPVVLNGLKGVFNKNNKQIITKKSFHFNK